MKKIFLIIFIALLFCGCSKEIDKFYLDDEYYNDGKFIDVEALDELENKKYILYTNNNVCNFPKPCTNIFEEFMSEYNIDIVTIYYEDFKNTKYYKEVENAPSIIIMNNGKIIDYLDINSEEDEIKYQSVDEFTKWISKYIYLTK